MFRSLFGRNAAAFAVAIGISWPMGASGQLAVVDAQANSSLQLILAELVKLNAAAVEQSLALAEISFSNSAILAAICGRTPIGRAAASALVENDDINIASTPINLFLDGIVPKGFDLPAVTDIQGLQKGVQDVMGLGHDALQIAQEAQRKVDQARRLQRGLRQLADDPAGAAKAQGGRIAVEVLRRIRKARDVAWTESITKTLAFSSYSLAEGGAAKTREGSLDLARRQADCLREDMAALNRTNLELLGRINHLIALQASEASVMSATAARSAPIWANPEEGLKQ